MDEHTYYKLLNEARETDEFAAFLHEARECYFKPAGDEPFHPFLMSLSDDKTRVYLALALETIFEQTMKIEAEFPEDWETAWQPALEDVKGAVVVSNEQRETGT